MGMKKKIVREPKSEQRKLDASRNLTPDTGNLKPETLYSNTPLLQHSIVIV